MTFSVPELLVGTKAARADGDGGGGTGYFRQGVGVEQDNLETHLASRRLGDWPELGRVSDDEVAICGHDDVFFLYKGSNHYHRAYSPADDDTELAEQWVAAFADWRRKCQELGTRFCVAIVPNKASLLPDLYPLELAHKLTCRMEKLIERAAPEDLAVFNAFFGRPETKALFRRNDSHLTDWGSRLLCDFVKRELGMPVADWDLDAEALSHTDHNGDLGGRFQPAAGERLVRFRHDWDQFEILEQSEPSRKGGFVGIGYHARNRALPDGARMMAFGNSFIERLPSWGAAPWLAATVSDFHFAWSAGIDFDAVERQAPDYVLFQTCERFLHRPPGDNA